MTAPPEDRARLAARVRELEIHLHRGRARNAALERGLSALSERVIALRADGRAEPRSPRRGRASAAG